MRVRLRRGPASAGQASPAAKGSARGVPADPVRALQHALYRAAKADPGRRFHALYDKVRRRDVLRRAWAAVRGREGYLRAQFLRLKSRRGPKKAILAVAASMLTAAYYMLRDGVDYRDLGADHFDRRDKAKLANRLVARLHDLGFRVELRAA